MRWCAAARPPRAPRDTEQRRWPLSNSAYGRAHTVKPRAGRNLSGLFRWVCAGGPAGGADRSAPSTAGAPPPPLLGAGPAWIALQSVPRCRILNLQSAHRGAIRCVQEARLVFLASQAADQHLDQLLQPAAFSTPTKGQNAKRAGSPDPVSPVADPTSLLRVY